MCAGSPAVHYATTSLCGHQNTLYIKQHKEPIALVPLRAHPVTGPGLHGANRTPGTCSRATGFFSLLLLEDSLHKEACSHSEGLSLPVLAVHLLAAC